MDIDEFLDRETSEVESAPEKKSHSIQSTGPKDSQDFSDLFDSLKSDLDKGNLDEAEHTYMQLWQALSSENFRWDQEMHDKLSSLSSQISSNMEKALLDLKIKSDKINVLISNAKQSLREGRKDTALKIYSEVQTISNSIPNVFFEEKKLIQDMIIEFYKEFKSTKDNEVLRKISAAINEIGLEVNKINDLLQKGDIQGASVEYTKCLHRYNQIPGGFLKLKNPIGLKLLDIYKNISIHNEISNLQRQLSIIPTLQNVPISDRHLDPQIQRSQIRPNPVFEKKAPLVVSPSNTFSKPAAAATQAPKPTMPAIKEALRASFTSKPDTRPLDARNEIKHHQNIPHPRDEPTIEFSKKPLNLTGRLDDKMVAVKGLTRDTRISQKSFSEMRNQIRSAAGLTSDVNGSFDETKEKIARAKSNFHKGLYEEASKDVDEVLIKSPGDVEAKALKAMIKTWQ